MSATLEELNNLINDSNDTIDNENGISIDKNEFNNLNNLEKLNEPQNNDFENDDYNKENINPLQNNASEIKIKKKLINAIELYEASNPTQAKKIRYPQSCGNYQFGDDLTILTVEQLRKIMKIQNSITTMESISQQATIMTIVVASVLETKISHLKGYSLNLSKSAKELEDCYKEILLEFEDIEEYLNPQTRLAIILIKCGAITYMNNKVINSNKPANIRPQVNGVNEVNEQSDKIQVAEVMEMNEKPIEMPIIKRGRGRPRKYPKN